MNVSMRKITVFVVLLSMTMFMGAVSAYAVSNEATTTVKATFVKLGTKSLTFEAGTSRGYIAGKLKSSLGRPGWIGPASFTITLGNSKRTLSRAEMNKILPSAINYDAMADLAFASGTVPKTITPANYLARAYTGYNKTSIAALASSIAKQYTSPAKSMKYAMSKKKFVITNASSGYTVSAKELENAIYAANLRWAEAGYGGHATASVSRNITSAGVAKRSQLGKAIKVDRSQRMLYLYSKGKVVAKYRVAIGMRGYTTPLGTYTIGAKRSKPTWGNPGSSWARNMPRFIGPGPSNPLGLRAMNMNKGKRDTGLRIHGTSNTRSLGTASSHGCIRVANKNIVKLFKKVPSGTKVFVQQ